LVGVQASYQKKWHHVLEQITGMAVTHVVLMGYRNFKKLYTRDADAKLATEN
jgi:hypothetical protein